MALIEYNPPLEPFLDEVYRDNHILVINKPSGLLSVPGNRPEYYDSAMTRVQQNMALPNRLTVWIWQQAVFFCSP